MLLIGSMGASAAERRTVTDWLEAMATAVDNLNYKGTIVYSRDDSLEVLSVVHKSDEQGSREKITTLNGEAREIIRTNDSVRGIFADKASVVMDARITEGLFPIIPYTQIAADDEHYRVRLAPGIDRVAGYRTRVVEIIPRDDYRFGQKLWLEENTAMLLKSRIIDESGQTREEMTFATVDLGVFINDRDLAQSLKSPTAVEIEITNADSTESGTAEMPNHWQVNQVPAGFVMTRHSHDRGQGRNRLEHLVFTDGLASVSVYIESIRGNQKVISGFREMGGLHVFGRQAGNVNITAMGEVPVKTLRLMAESVQRVHNVATE